MTQLTNLWAALVGSRFRAVIGLFGRLLRKLVAVLRASTLHRRVQSTVQNTPDYSVASWQPNGPWPAVYYRTADTILDEPWFLDKESLGGWRIM